MNGSGRLGSTAEAAVMSFFTKAVSSPAITKVTAHTVARRITRKFPRVRPVFAADARQKQELILNRRICRYLPSLAKM